MGGAALFTPYIANQIKGAVTGVVNGPVAPSGGPSVSATAFSPKTVQSGVPQKINVNGINLAQIQGAIYTLQGGAEHPLAATNINVLNSGSR